MDLSCRAFKRSALSNTFTKVKEQISLAVQIRQFDARENTYKHTVMTTDDDNMTLGPKNRRELEISEGSDV